MNAKHLTVTGPFTHENLSIFLLRGSDALDGSRFIPLDEALEQKCVTVHETGNVGQLEVENLSDSLDLYIQAGDVVKGGRQDRTLGEPQQPIHRHVEFEIERLWETIGINHQQARASHRR